ncbi:hypothetical protein EUA06_05820 [Nocardioides glacieisoli]|uniref:Thrombospondin n=1 Tax=Nocardioides glacieisoli TaxID=1168730 RepID=A0A4Q2RX43_9ACTN|nr:thrombospondin type 3 repeat-containing protein [Nocardioides glacieisoli]RYB92469.1 hypothetical protein EUA06_05820 [Nocardioides glacieisoli]
MGDTRGMRALVAMVLLMTTGFVTLASGPAAVAAGGLPDRCVESRSGTTVRFDSNVPATDLDVRIWVGYQEIRSDIYLVSGPEYQYGPRWLLTDQFNRLGQPGGVTFDNQAPYGYYDSPPSSGEVRVRPKQELPEYWSGDYTFSIESGMPMPSDITVTVTWADCDEDRDFHGDKTRDNCVGLHNPEQFDLDRDGKGDPCDPDDDNDNVADVSDNCPTTANDQTDWDGDRIGNACDTTPGIAPPPPATTPVPPGTTTPPGTVPPPPGCTASCAYASTIGLRHQKARHRLTGKVESVAFGCRAGVEVTIWRKKSGEGRKLVVVTTRSTAKFRTRAPRRAGRYYATVGSPAQPLCGNATSRVVRIRKR